MGGGGGEGGRRWEACTISHAATGIGPSGVHRVDIVGAVLEPAQGQRQGTVISELHLTQTQTRFLMAPEANTGSGVGWGGGDP